MKIRTGRRLGALIVAVLTAAAGPGLAQSVTLPGQTSAASNNKCPPVTFPNLWQGLRNILTYGQQQQPTCPVSNSGTNNTNNTVYGNGIPVPPQTLPQTIGGQ